MNEPTKTPVETKSDEWAPETCIVRRGDWLCIASTPNKRPWEADRSERVRISNLTGYHYNGAAVALSVVGFDPTGSTFLIRAPGAPATGFDAAMGLRIVKRLDELLDTSEVLLDATGLRSGLPETPPRLEKMEPDERAQILDEILAILAEAGVPTPEQTYKQDGGFSLALSDIKRALTGMKALRQWWDANPNLLQHRVHAAEAEQARLLGLLEQANAICRSMQSIVDRQGVRTDWSAFSKQLTAELELQHEALHPKVTDSNPSKA